MYFWKDADPGIAEVEDAKLEANLIREGGNKDESSRPSREERKASVKLG